MAPLLPESIGPDAPRALATWIDEARASAQPQATSMTLATAAADGRPSARMVFVRGWGPRGIEWITDEASRKARDLMAQPHAAGVFFWAGLGRQARVEGPVHLLAPDEVAAYMARRRPEARRAARAWRQGERLESRADLRRRLAAAGGEPDPPGIPDGWIGHRLEPHLIEFWQEDPDGLHDRLVARLTGDDWSIERVAP